MQKNIYEKESISIIVFNVGWEEFAIDLLDVKEIIQAGQVRKLPKSMDFIDGIYNYRGEIIHIINLRKKLNLDEYKLYRSKEELYESKEGEEDTTDATVDGSNGESEKKYIIIVNVDNTNIGFYADKIHNVSQIGSDDIVDLTPIFQTSVDVNYIKGVIRFEDRPRILINLSKVLTEAEAQMIQKELDSRK